MNRSDRNDMPCNDMPRRARRPRTVTTETGIHVLLRHHARTRDRGVRDVIVAHYSSLVRALACRFRSGTEPLDDLMQVASVGLIRAIDRYDPERGLPFPVYAAPSILGELKHHFRDGTWQVKVPRSMQERLLRVRRTENALSVQQGAAPTPADIAQEMGVTEEDVLEAMEIGRQTRADSLDRLLDPAGGEDGGCVGDRVGVWDAGLSEWESSADLCRALSCLNPREREILRLRFWEDCSQAQVAERLGLSQMHVSRLQTRALARLKGILE